MKKDSFKFSACQQLTEDLLNADDVQIIVGFKDATNSRISWWTDKQRKLIKIPVDIQLIKDKNACVAFRSVLDAHFHISEMPDKEIFQSARWRRYRLNDKPEHFVFAWIMSNEEHKMLYINSKAITRAQKTRQHQTSKVKRKTKNKTNKSTPRVKKSENEYNEEPQSLSNYNIQEQLFLPAEYVNTDDILCKKSIVKTEKSNFWKTNWKPLLIGGLAGLTLGNLLSNKMRNTQ